MGQKINPNSFRLGITKNWPVRWFIKGGYPKFLEEDEAIRRVIKEKISLSGVSAVEWSNDPSLALVVQTGGVFLQEIPSFDLWDDAPASKAELIVIDECSMVDAELGRDLLSFGVPVLVLGDPAQLPPIQGGGFFTETEPDVMLTEVHRQAAGNPIIRLSMDIRAGEYLKPGRYGETEVVRKDDLDPQRVLEADQVLVGRNATRRAYNIRMRERRGFTETMPSAGDKLVCLRNNRKKGLFNGGLWSVKERGGRKNGIMTMRLMPDDETAIRGVKVSVRPECFTGGIEQIDWQRRKPYDEFDYGYVLTVHKAQGSQWDDVVLFDESFAFPESRERWLYTGVTRAAKKLTVVM